MPGNCLFRLFALDPASGKFELYHSKANGMKGTEDAAGISDYMAAYKCFHNNPVRAYERDVYGPTVYEGGSGIAEQRALEIIN